MDELATTRGLLNDLLDQAVIADPLQALGSIAAVQRDIEEHQRAAVRAATQGHTWAQIGAAIGVSKQAAHQRYTKQWANTLRDELKGEIKTLKVALKEQDYETAAVAKANRDALIAEFKGVHTRHR